MKKQTTEGEGNKGRSNEGSKSINMKNRNWKPKEKKKMRGLSLEAFANAKSGCYNPSTISIKASSFILCFQFFNKIVVPFLLIIITSL